VVDELLVQGGVAAPGADAAAKVDGRLVPARPEALRRRLLLAAAASAPVIALRRRLSRRPVGSILSIGARRQQQGVALAVELEDAAVLLKVPQHVAEARVVRVTHVVVAVAAPAAAAAAVGVAESSSAGVCALSAMRMWWALNTATLP
jgi:hypothetical protein